MEIRGWVLYDDACGFCRGWVPFWGPTLRRRGLEIAPLQSPWVRDAVTLADGDLLDDLRLLLRDGRQVQGADVYRYVMRRIWWAWPFYVLACAPGLRRVFNAAYRAFATHRHRFSRACGLPGAAGEGTGIPAALPRGDSPSGGDR
jgi:predicted DCC family thiol-disulfide oxidoreductase YuxK